MKKYVKLFEQYEESEGIKSVLPAICSDAFEKMYGEMEGKAEQDQDYPDMYEYEGDVEIDYPEGNEFLQYAFTLYMVASLKLRLEHEDMTYEYPGSDEFVFVSGSCSEIAVLPEGSDDAIEFEGETVDISE